jgi:hypothetical protein
MPHVLTLLGAVGVTQITIHPPTLEEIFMSHYQTNEV